MGSYLSIFPVCGNAVFGCSTGALSMEYTDNQSRMPITFQKVRLKETLTSVHVQTPTWELVISRSAFQNLKRTKQVFIYGHDACRIVYMYRTIVRNRSRVQL